MYVVHVIPNLASGGAEQSLVRLALSHVSQRPEDRVEVVTLDGANGPLANQLRNAGIKVRDLRTSRSKWARAGASALRFMRYLSVQRPDVVHAWMYHAALLGCLSQIRLRRPILIWSIRTSQPPARQKRGTYCIIRACAWLSKWLPASIVYCARSARSTHEEFGFSPRRGVYIPNGIVVDQDVPSRRRNDGLPFTVGCMGRFHPAKGHEILIAALEQLKMRGRSFHVLLAGRGVHESNSVLVRSLRDAGVVEDVSLMGEFSGEEDRGSFLADLDLYCSPSHAEGFPNSIAEAMARGIPIVATDVGDARALIDGAGVVVPAGEPVAVCDAIEGMMVRTQAERGAIGQVGRERIREEFSLRSMVNGYLGVYDRCLGGGT